MGSDIRTDRVLTVRRLVTPSSAPGGRGNLHAPLIEANTDPLATVGKAE